MHEQSKRVVVVDDDPGIRQALARLLGAAGLEVVTFDSAESFLASGSATGTEVLVLDVLLPGMTGPELHARLDSQGLAGPAIFITGQAGPKQLERIRGIQAPCFTKPFPGHDLIASVRERLPAA